MPDRKKFLERIALHSFDGCGKWLKTDVLNDNVIDDRVDREF